MSTVQLENLEGVEKGTLVAFIPVDLSQALGSFRRCRTILGDGPDGSMTVWQDDTGQYRFQFHRDKNFVAGGLSRDPQRVADWMEAWWQRMGVKK